MSNAFLVSNSEDERYEKSKWLVDSGASEHMCCDRSLLSSFSSVSQKSVIVGNGAIISVLGSGKMVVQVYNGSEWVDTTIDNVLFVPELKTNLFSVNRAADRGYVMMTDNNTCRFYKSIIVCAVANRLDNSYYIEFRFKSEHVNVAEVVKNDLYKWHQKLAHQNFNYVKKVLKKNNIVVKQTNVPQCESCLKGKIHRLPFMKSESVSTKTCELIHGDTCGPMEEESIGGSRYFVVLKDDYSNFRTVYLVKTKDEIKHCLEDFLNRAENVTGNKVKTFRTDNGLEFINKEVKEMCSKKGIIHQTTVYYTPEQNGKAERVNRTLVEAARTMLHAKNLHKKLWAEAVNTAAFVLNRTVYAHIPNEKRRKVDKKAEKGLMVGYGEETKGYRIYFTEKNFVFIKRDVVFLNKEKDKEKETIMLDLDSQSTNDNMVESVTVEEITESEVSQPNPSNTHTSLNKDMSLVESECSSEYIPSDDELSEVDEIVQVRDERPRLTRKQTLFYECNNLVSEKYEPATYEEAIKRSDSSKWREAMNKELQNLRDNNTWDFCSAPASGEIINKVADEETKDLFYQKLKATMEEVHKTVLVIGDMNALIGTQMRSENKYLSPYTSGRRNNNGQRLIDFAQEHNITIMNTFFNKNPKKKWTWISPNGNVKKEIDFIMTNRPQLFKDVIAINQFNFNSDHRMVRRKLTMSHEKQSRKCQGRNGQQMQLPLPDNILSPLKQNFPEQCKIQDHYNILENALKKIEIQAQAIKSPKDKWKLPKIIGKEARELIITRQTLKQAKPIDRKQISEISKKINYSIRNHRQKTRQEKFILHIEMTGNVKKSKKELQEYTNWIPEMKETKDSKKKTKRPEILEIATKFYQNLCNDETPSTSELHGRE
ncbi:Retrovirus-related Pol polyprotein from transposon TNT 1-94 [Eumeta japonica]|uniref:Retrovirus-related Pol polyprotein from transposon TNT 1-94 n=1 Tax=Eumeta variegata TaxID=151549 RepID=A0A4C1U0D8_EUMVA|nr:Retrovirus-related Pol polyprotein from transposon TNT 1-94 [Eumeta japonica]